MAAEDFFVRDGLPPGMTNDEPVPYGYRRWNGVGSSPWEWCSPA